MVEQVKCRDCGYLALRKKDTRELVDAEECYRKDGTVPGPGMSDKPDSHLRVFDVHYEKPPICFVRAADLRKESGENAEKRAEVVNRPRKCAKFTSWEQGFTPKEVVEMRLSEKLETRNRLTMLLAALLSGLLTLAGTAFGYWLRGG